MTTAVRKKKMIVDEPLYEVVDGIKVEVPPMGAWAGRVASRLMTKMNMAAEKTGAGEAMVEVLFRLKEGFPQRRPDIAIVSRHQLTDDMAGPDDPPVYAVAPEIVVEVASPTNSLVAAEAKVREYFAAGARLVWVVFPTARRIPVYESANSCKILDEGDVLDGGAVLPELRLPLADLFGKP